MNPYEILDIDPLADDAAIKEAYKMAAQRSHPDRKGGSEEDFKAVNDAYESIKTAAAREEYDSRLSEPETRLQFLFASVIDSDEFDGDIIDTCRAKIRKVMSGLIAGRQVNKRSLRLLERQLGRVTVTGRNLYEPLLKDRIESIESVIEHNDVEHEMLEEVMELLLNYDDNNGNAGWITLGGTKV